jgi:hypothetical protein
MVFYLKYIIDKFMLTQLLENKFLKNGYRRKFISLNLL